MDSESAKTLRQRQKEIAKALERYDELEGQKNLLIASKQKLEADNRDPRIITEMKLRSRDHRGEKQLYDQYLSWGSIVMRTDTLNNFIIGEIVKQMAAIDENISKLEIPTL